MKELGLWLLSWVYLGFYRTWAGLYRLGLKQGYQAKVPVISVGNLSLGGTGKTPLVDWLLGFLLSQGLRPGLVTRGYGRSQRTEEVLVLQGTQNQYGPQDSGDEPWTLHLAHPEVPIAVHAKRDLAAQALEGQVDLLVMDDGFQHWRLRRDLDLVLLDGMAGVKENRLLPWGRLREPLSALKRVQALLITRSNWGDPKGVERWAAPYLSPGCPVFYFGYQPKFWRPLSGGAKLEARGLKGKRVFAFCGIGKPEGFLKALEELEVQVVGFTALQDHQAYSEGLALRLSSEAKALGAELLLCTQKDAVKLSHLSPVLGPAGFLEMELEVPPDWTLFLCTFLRPLRPQPETTDPKR
ncbi:MAG: tetraacyldisaccharide 4'-kinase [Candidatus Lambdaproteobacteria bacterium RIFOXYD1_FULL_56_27]|uniref:Tetraacyldisaccharide 4'-kinase n=1 Tax=Candidatus Lambdaproteobacteria bacterium RIFOXYD2_FULL_56_26 TaxID=1817773 RepID=A0A1F6GLE4_9PROT|nr:MAG: tetraacyldisaccharide 4'-kinase [Candidatus Lambdaproteobacteria bacterium RIFOXYD2_FULL_56_26]OGH05474.1 MAG: tetraacyldisaccharide 4'-kinase [Candidatus Lambdaproteobacteria bacterium RIFOXYC1_FULL_56_13]OGH09765.1 MAG: tetraacyldisaccharide 4'-kinase [Candidatus Lambdaproteobacteria bacterium RIFOXYD1_FULL_56_27]